MKLTTEEHAKLMQNARKQFNASIELKQKFMEGDYLETLISMSEVIVRSLAQGGKLLLCGNGGSAADAQHLAAEMLIRLRSSVNRDSIPAIALALDTSTITACGNDYGFERLYERLVQGLGKSKDVLLGITTSGRSPNVIRALKAAREKGIVTLGFLGGNGGDAKEVCDLAIVVPYQETDRIQEVHITAGHIMMELIEDLMLEKKHITLEKGC